MVRLLAGLACIAGCGGRPAPPPPVQRAPAPTIAPAAPALELPEVALAGYADADGLVPTVTVSRDAIVLGGRTVAALHDGALAAGDIAKLESAIGAAAGPDVTLAFDRRVPFTTLAQTVRVVGEHGANRFRLLARSGGRSMAVLFERDLPPPTERHGSPSAVEDIQDEIVHDAIPDLQRCHADVVKRTGALAGRLEVQFVITRAGRVDRAKLTGVDALHECIRARLPRWSFTEPDHEQGIVLALDVPAFTATVANDGSPKRTGPGFHVEKIDGKPVTVIDTVVYIQEPVGLVATIGAQRIAVWSRAGDEGTHDAPKLVLDRASPRALSELTAGLAEIVKRRWSRGRSIDDDQQIVIEVEDPVAQLQFVAEALGAVRLAPDGFPLFPDIRLVAR